MFKGTPKNSRDKKILFKHLYDTNHIDKMNKQLNYNKAPLVSVIVPNYNHARYLDKRMETILGQTYPNFEVIILDDCSTDNSIEVIARYKDNPHLKQVVVSDTNSGSPFKQWDKGIHLATGDLIWIAESDDYCELNFLEELVKAYTEKPNVVVAFCQYVLFSDDYTLAPKEHKTRYYNGRKYICNRLLRYNEIQNASGVIFSHEAYSHISQDYLTYKSAGDLHFWCELLQCGDCAKVGKNLTYFRHNSTSVTNTNGSRGIVSTEDKRVYDYVSSVYELSHWQKRMIHIKKMIQYQTEHYDTKEIRQRILDLWGIKDGEHPSRLDSFILWLAGSLERHLGILI